MRGHASDGLHVYLDSGATLADLFKLDVALKRFEVGIWARG